ncbi:MAG TPA: lipid-binding SYLF domain-containing protein [Stellaceae bacterium]|nr:lipid-binding SYLF domain-containing protein [Stellaceae bacterium]
MIRKWTFPALFLAAFVAAPLIASDDAAAQEATPPWKDQQILVDKAVAAIGAMRDDQGFPKAKDLLGHAKAVMIVPELTKGGLIVGGQGGAAVFLARLLDGSWSYPAFYSIGGGTLGLQIGVQRAQMVFLIMSDRAVQAWMTDRVKFGGQGGVAVFVVGDQNKPNAMTQDRADVVVWSRAAGAYAGINFEGTSVSFDRDGTAKYYGKPAAAEDVLLQGGFGNPAANPLRSALFVH